MDLITNICLGVFFVLITALQKREILYKEMEANNKRGRQNVHGFALLISLHFPSLSPPPPPFSYLPLLLLSFPPSGHLSLP